MYIRIAGILDTLNVFPKYVSDQILLKEFSFHIFEIGLTANLIKRKVKAWHEMPISIGPFQFLNHVHSLKELEDYLDYKRLPTPIRRHVPKGLIIAHFHKLGLVTQYRHEIYLDDYFFEDEETSKNVLEHMRARHLPEERITSLG